MVRNRLVNRARARVAFIQVGFKKLKNGLFMVVVRRRPEIKQRNYYYGLRQ